MKRSLFILIFIGLASAASAQVKLLSLKELDARLENGKDTTFVVNFWATWCGPCIEELPYFDQLQVARKKDKVKVLLVSLDFISKLKVEVIPFVKKRGLRSEVYLLSEKSQQVYIDHIDKEWTGAIPATLFVNTSLNRRKFYEKEFTYSELVSNLDMFIK